MTQRAEGVYVEIGEPNPLSHDRLITITRVDGNGKEDVILMTEPEARSMVHAITSKIVIV